MMDSDALLPYYEREIAFLREEAGEFARRYPRVAGDLMLSEQGSEDPNIRRLMQSVALLTARVNMRLGDDYAGFAENLLDALYPQHSQARPSCAIARFSRASMGSSEIMSPDVSTRHGALPSVRFKALFSPSVSDPDVSGVEFHGAQPLIFGDDVWTGASLCLSFDSPVPPDIRLFVAGNPSFAPVIRDALFFDVQGLAVQQPSGSLLSAGSLSWVSPDDVEALVPSMFSDHPGYDLLRDLFCFPDKFGFFDIRLPELGFPVQAIRLLLSPTDGSARDTMLSRLKPGHLLTRCAPVVNLYSSSVTFGPRDAGRSQYTITGTHAKTAVVAVRSVHLRSGEGTRGEAVPHYFHGRRPGAARSGCFWVSHPGGPTAADPAPDGSIRLMLVDDERRPLTESTTLSVEALCCDSDVPALLASGTSSAVLHGGSRDEPVARLLTSPTRYESAPPRKEAGWHLLSHLRLSHSSLLGPDAAVLREFLALHAPQHSDARHSIDGVIGVARRGVTQWMPGEFPPTLVRGTEITLTVDETHFVGLGLHAWVQVLDRFFAAYAQINSFTQLVLRSSQTGKEIHRCPPNTGTGPLI
ncbi:type VI secretion system baseplate subunit TssF [Luteibacter sp.]|jgi:type VI secretion system protein ImpG|uniref:type VI secretion system baseplate subunit TssF n=1 Tax=Luteibacter sp. TaxID=1886636 RepID=UPI002F405CC6